MDITYAVIDLNALQQNFAILQQSAAPSKILAVVKANAYGHGMVKVAETLTDAHAFGVARLNEALLLRDAGISKPIVLLEGFFNDHDLITLVDQDLQSVVHSEQQVNAILKAQLSKPVQIWLKLDTGMHRLGFHPERFDDVYLQLKNSKNVQKPIHLITHFSCADELDNPSTNAQINLFKEHIKDDSGLNSLASSAAILAWPQAHYDIIRPGIALYGVSPFADKDASDFQLKPVMTLKSRLIAVRDHKAGESVGYGANWTAKQDTKLGVVAVGYGDGYPRMAPEGTPVLVNGRLVPIVGRVSMDMLTVDLGANSTDQVGSDVTLWGEGLAATQVANHIGTIAYELLTKLTARVALQYRE
ncbi:alanine racemase [Psychromonas antarctica]|uniref:alanine racemase n=1 Tax=Psychromonas antarctica TaxID=67573 RepID=UPI001EE7C10D|nr:alanine racemase [Psychromonas antarctica]MCG6201585.1 alanine racemase [Psychromonas antarctica]